MTEGGVYVKANVVKIKELIKINFNGNKSRFAIAVGVNRSQISTIINKNGIGAGANFFGGLMVYCESNNLNFKDYVILPLLSKY